MQLFITKSARLDSNQRSRRPKRRGMTKLPHAQSHLKRPAGVEPALPPWQGSRLPLHHGRVCGYSIVKELGEARGRRPEVREKRGVPFSPDLRPLTSLLSPSGVGGSRTRNVPVKSRVLCLSASTPRCVHRRLSFSWRPGDRTQRVELIRPNRSTRPLPPIACIIQWLRRELDSHRFD